MAFPEHAKVVIIGLGGIVGASVAHHLIERGWDDIVGIDKSGIPTDIGSTAQQYAREAFERYGADAVTLSPFMGFDSVQPYLDYQGKGAFLLCRTSNPGGDDLQNQRLASVEGQPLLYEHVARLAQGPGTAFETLRERHARPW